MRQAVDDIKLTQSQQAEVLAAVLALDGRLQEALRSAPSAPEPVPAATAAAAAATDGTSHAASDSGAEPSGSGIGSGSDSRVHAGDDNSARMVDGRADGKSEVRSGIPEAVARGGVRGSETKEDAYQRMQAVLAARNPDAKPLEPASGMQPTPGDFTSAFIPPPRSPLPAYTCAQAVYACPSVGVVVANQLWNPVP